MVIPEILEHLDEDDLEDWLTAAFIEHQRQLPLDHLCTNGNSRSTSSAPDIWMVELTDRSGQRWSGRFNVDFSQKQKFGDDREPVNERATGEVRLTLDTETAKVTFNGEQADASPVGGQRE
jgi:hypothetical protein